MLHKLTSTVATGAATSLSLTATLLRQQRWQSQSYPGHQVPFEEGQQKTSTARRLDPNNIPHFIKNTIQNDRREFGLNEVDDWAAFAEEAIYLPTRAGPLWVGADDPRCQRLVKRREKLRVQPGQVPRAAPKKDPAKALENHPLRRYFTTSTELSDPLSVANGLHQSGMIKSTDVKYVASKMEYKKRPPIITIMGHVDHGKTTLLDYLRKSNVVSSEAGGITQSIGAFKVKVGDGDYVTFVDTPGHAAFNSMREAGANITDIIIVVISATDGVQPQTEEVLEIARTTHVPIVIAVSKVDRRNDIEHITKRLKELDVELEEDGGDVQLVKISAIDGTGIPDLMEAIKLQSELGEISTPVHSRTELLVIESQVAAAQNEVAAIVRCGNLKPNMTFVSGLTHGTVKKFQNEHDEIITLAGVCEPIRFSGYPMLPKPGNILMQVSGEEHGRNYHLFMKEVYKTEGGRESFLQTLSLEARGQFFNRKPDNNSIRSFEDIPFNVVAKAATFGMLQALLKMIYDLPRLPGIALNVKITEVGGIRDTDIAIAGGTNQAGAFLVFGDCKDENFMSIPTYMSQIRFNVLYHGIRGLQESMVAALPKLQKVRVLASATCSQTFRASQAGRGGNAAGVLVTRGTIAADGDAFQVLRRVKRDDAELSVVHEGTLKELRRFKDQVPSVEQGLECGLIMHDFMFEIGDVINQVEHYEEDRDVDEEFQMAEELERRWRLQEQTQQPQTSDNAAAS